MTFTNPAPQSYYGHPVAAAGTDFVLVGVPAYGTNCGAVLVFNTNGTLLTTIANPTPAADDLFGNRIEALGNDRVVIGARGDDTGAAGSGAAYVFNVEGTLLHTLTNPAPAIGDGFGLRVAAFGSEGVIIGAPDDDAGAANAGSVYLFSVPSQPIAPSLSIHLTSSNTVAISWPSPSTGFVLQRNTNGVSSVNWSNVTTTVQDDGTTRSISVSPSAGACFYRLFKP